jgi:hypothetical protein
MGIYTYESDELKKLHKKMRETRLKLEILESHPFNEHALKKELYRLQLIIPSINVKIITVKNDGYNIFNELIPTKKSKIKNEKFIDDVELLYKNLGVG